MSNKKDNVDVVNVDELPPFDYGKSLKEKTDKANTLEQRFNAVIEHCHNSAKNGYSYVIFGHGLEAKLREKLESHNLRVKTAYSKDKNNNGAETKISWEHVK